MAGTSRNKKVAEGSLGAASAAADAGDTIRPTLRLSDLAPEKARAEAPAGMPSGFHEDDPAKIVDDGALRGEARADRRMIEQVRARLRLPALEQVGVQARAPRPANAAASASARSKGASALARAAADAIPAPGDGGPVLPPAQAEPADSETATMHVATARDLGQLVREARERRKLSQQAFADLVGVGRRFISELENGKPTLEIGKVLQVVAATGISVLARRRR